MHPRYRLLSVLTTMVFLAAATMAMAGWGDALKEIGGDYADEGAKAAGLSYTPSEAVTGIKEVLSLGTDYGVSSLGVPGGFSSNPATALSLPDSLSSLSSLGGSSSGLLSALNGAAEGAIPETGNIFMDTIQGLAVGDYSTLLGGGENAITKFFETSSRDTLKKLVRPVVEQSVEAAGVDSYLAPLAAAQTASNLSGAAGVTSTAFDPIDFVTDKTLDGMFVYMGLKEKDIRSSSGTGTSDILQKLF